jgi:hypothetical protein
MAQRLESRDRAPEALTPIWAEVKAYLENTLTRLNSEISRYPTPIARCDEQLTGLLEQRAEALTLLASVEDAVRALARIEAFLDSRSHGADQADQNLRSRLKEQLSALKV